jgi:uncharacterized membrane protein YbhN (UPF0104 family)
MRLPMSSRPLQAARHAVWLVAGLGLLALVVLWAGWSGLTLAALQEASPALLLLALLPAAVAPVVHAWRWQRMLLVLDQVMPLRAALRATVAATLANYAVPGYAWAPVKGLVARQAYGVALTRSAPTLAVEQALDAAALALGVGLGLLLMPGLAVRAQFQPPRDVFWLVLPAGAALVALPALRRSGRFNAHLAALRSSGRQLLGSRALHPWLASLTLARLVCDLVSFWLVAAALGQRLDPAQLLLLASLPPLAGLVTPIPGGLGVREGGVVAVGTLLGLPAGPLAGAALLHRTVLLAGLPLALVTCSIAPRSRP